jgi:hypothetical protein
MIRIRYLIFMIFMCCSNFLFAQAWGGGADQTDLSFGFSFSYVQNSFKIVKHPNWRNPFFDADANTYVTDSLNSVSSKALPGFAVGFITRYRLTEHLEARVTPSLVFADRAVSYIYKTESQNVDKSVQTTTVDLPLQIKIKSDRVGNIRAYLIGGAKFSAAIGTKKNSDVNAGPLEKALKNVKNYSSYEAGFGFDIYFEYFKLSPEVKVSNSFTNMLVPENHPYATPISKLNLHTIMFSLYFE